MHDPITLELAAPLLLVAMPPLRGGPFGEAVLLLMEHGDKGSLGLVVNHATDVTLKTFCDALDVKLDAARDDDAVHVGGPVQPEAAFVLHTGAHRGAETVPIVPPLAVSFAIESLVALAKTPPDFLRVCAGHAGWAPGQLAREISDGAWMVAQAEPAFIVATPPEKMWAAILARMGIAPMQLMHSSRLN